MAEEMFRPAFNTKSAGFYNQKPVTADEISWADTVIVMEEEQRSELAKRFPKQYLQKRILCLDIPDIYNFNNQKLVAELQNKIDGYQEILSS